jgi:hypothetical protein
MKRRASACYQYSPCRAHSLRRSLPLVVFGAVLLLIRTTLYGRTLNLKAKHESSSILFQFTPM